MNFRIQKFLDNFQEKCLVKKVKALLVLRQEKFLYLLSTVRVGIIQLFSSKSVIAFHDSEASLCLCKKP